MNSAFSRFVWVCVCICVCTCAEVRGGHWVSSSVAVCLVLFRWGLSLKWGSFSTRLAGQQISKIFLSLLAPMLGYMVTASFFYLVKVIFLVVCMCLICMRECQCPQRSEMLYPGGAVVISVVSHLTCAGN